MTEDLFQLVALGLLALLVVLLVMIAMQLVRIRAALTRSEGSASDAGAPSPAGPDSAAVATHDDGAGPTQDDTSSPEGHRSDATSSEAPAEALARETSETPPATTPEDSAPSSTRSEPFERDGRWWFERDGELLVYDEQRGEWVPDRAGPEATPTDEPRPQLDPDPTHVELAGGTEGGEQRRETDPPGDAFTHPLDEPRPGDVSAPSAQDDGAPVTTTPGDAPADGGEEGAPEAASTYWKCPSCGVVNGSTASLCRMCFTARP